MRLEYEDISFMRLDEYRKVLAACPSIASDYTFANLWGWAEAYGLKWAFHQGMVFIRQSNPGTFEWAPVGDWAGFDWAGFFADPEAPRHFIRVPEALTAIWRARLGAAIQINETRGHWDYLYRVDELISLSGNKFHKKKNLYNQFERQYNFDYREMKAKCVESVLDMQKDWCAWLDCQDSPALLAENTAIERVLRFWDKLPCLVGAAIYIDEVMAAYTVAEFTSEDTVVIHFEKGHTRFKGIYQAINRLFLTNTASVCTYVNREQDLDDPGLRKSKESYNPVDYIKKYEVTV